MTQKAKAGATQDPETASHIAVRPIYTPADLDAWDYDHQLGYPGEYPFTRGVQATMYRGRLWTMRQYAGMGDAEESNKRYKYLLANGTTGLSVAFDLPRKSASTPTMCWQWGKSARWEWPLIPSKTCSGCLRGLT